MRKSIYVLAVLVAACLPAPTAHAAMPRPQATILRQPCPVTSGELLTTGICTDIAAAVIYLPPTADRFAKSHELGHLFDAQYLDDLERGYLIGLLGLPMGAWIRGTGLTRAGLRSPNERFADAYAACDLGLDPRHRWETAYDYQPTWRQHRRVCAAIRVASRSVRP